MQSERAGAAPLTGDSCGIEGLSLGSNETSISQEGNPGGIRVG